MSKVNVDEIQVGDLVCRYSKIFKKGYLGLVTKIEGSKVYALWNDDVPTRALWVSSWNITGHWKVINFEEESKMNDELKVYAGKETLQALLEGKTLERYNKSYRFTDKLQVDFREGKGWENSAILINDLLGFKFTEVVTPQVGDWVKVNFLDFTHTAKIDKIIDNQYWANWEGKGLTYYDIPSKGVTWEILSPEQVSEYKRELAFSKVGRKLNEFKPEDIVYVESLEKVMVVISKINTDKVMLREINYTGSGRHAARPHQLKPICFAENQEDLS